MDCKGSYYFHIIVYMDKYMQIICLNQQDNLARQIDLKLVYKNLYMFENT